MNTEINLVLGCPRSGTTFLMECLKALPYSECVSGHILPIFIPHLVNSDLPKEVYQTMSLGVEFSLKEYLDTIGAARVPLIHKWVTGCIDFQELWQALHKSRPIHRLIYKEPFLSFAPQFTYESLPNCRIIHIYRDGRDAADSLARTYKVLTDEKLSHLSTAEMPLGRQVDYRYVPWWVAEGKETEFLSCTPYVRGIWMWKEMMRRCHEFFSRPEIVAENRVMLLRYEDLVNDPVKWGNLVIEHFGGQMNSRLVKKFQQAKASSIGIHQRREQKEIALAEEIAYQELKLYGYI